MKTLELKTIDRTETHQIWVNDEPYLLKGMEANLVTIFRKFPVKTRIELMKLSENDCAEYFKDKRQSYRETALEILSKKWYDRETDTRFTLKHFECEFIEGYPSFQKVKKDVKNDKLNIRTLSKIIEHFTGDYSEFYTKD